MLNPTNEIATDIHASVTRSIASPEVRRGAATSATVALLLRRHGSLDAPRAVDVARALLAVDLDEAGTLAPDDVRALLDLEGRVHHVEVRASEGVRSTPTELVHRVGALLFTMLTGRAPGRDEPEIALALELERRSVSASLQTTVLCCLAALPVARFQSLEDLSRALETVPEAERGTLAERENRPARLTPVPSRPSEPPRPEAGLTRWSGPPPPPADSSAPTRGSSAPPAGTRPSPETPVLWLFRAAFVVLALSAAAAIARAWQ